MSIKIIFKFQFNYIVEPITNTHKYFQNILEKTNWFNLFEGKVFY